MGTTNEKERSRDAGMFDPHDAAPSPEVAAHHLVAAASQTQDPDREPPSTLPGADLTEAMRNFALAWLKTGVKSEAYRLAYPGTKSGKTAKTEGARLSRDPRILRYVEAIRQKVLDLSSISVSQIEHQVARIAFADMRKAFRDEGGAVLLDPDQWPDDIALAAQGYEEIPSKYGTHQKLKFPDKNQALRLLAELKGALGKSGDGDGAKADFHFYFGGDKRAANAGRKSAIAGGGADTGARNARGRAVEGDVIDGSAYVVPEAETEGAS